MDKFSPQNLEKLFSLSRRDLFNILDIALSRGGDFSELFLEYKTYNFVNMEEDIIKETAETITRGLGIRVISGEKTGYGYSNDLSFERIKRTARTAAAIATGEAVKRPSPLNSLPIKHNFYPILKGPHQETLEKKISLVKQAYLAAQNFDQKIKKVKVTFLDQTQAMTIANSEGKIVTDRRPLVKLACLAIAERGARRESGYHGGGGRVDLGYFFEGITPEIIGKEAAKEALNLLKAIEPPAGEMPVVLAPGHSGVLIHEAVGHLLEADFNRKKTSIFWNKMGKKVGSSQLFIYDDPTIPHFRGSYNIDDEGTFPQKTLLIEKGKMVGLLQDRLSARLMKAPLTGHGRRQDFTCIPIPRMSNTYIDRGEFTPEEILGSVKKGFYAHKYQGGQVEDSGKFTFSVSSGFIIEEGKLTTPIKQATLIGSNIDILNKIEMVGSDLEFSLQTGTCAKGGQAIPVSDGCPSIKISKMTVGGMR